MKTLNTAVVNFVAANTTTLPSIQAYFNGMLEGLTSNEVLVGSYYNTLTSQGKVIFNTLFTEVSEEVVSVSKAIKNRSHKLRKQISAMNKRRVKKGSKVARATAPIFTTPSLFSTMEAKASELLRRVGIKATETPILELMSIPATDAAFIFHTEELCSALKAVINMAAKVLAA